MAVEVLAVDGVGADDEFTNHGGANKPASLAAPDDEDATYLDGTAGINSLQRVTFANAIVILPADTINSVTIRVRARKTAPFSGSFTMSQYDGSSESTSGSNTLTATYADFDYVRATAPSGGGWTLAKVNALTSLISLGGTGTDRFTTVTARVDYTAAPLSCNVPTKVSASYYNVSASGVVHRVAWAAFAGFIQIDRYEGGVWTTSEASYDASIGEFYDDTPSVVMSRTYWYRVRNVCGGGLFSDWVYVVAVEHTAADPRTYRHRGKI